MLKSCSILKFFCLLFFFLNFFSEISDSLGQNKSLRVELKCNDCISKNFPEQFSSKEALFETLEQIKQLNLTKGFLAFSIDSVTFDTLKAIVYGTRGNRYYLNDWNCTPEMYTQFLPKLKTPKVFNSKKIEQAANNLLATINSEGYATCFIKKEMEVNSNNISILFQLNLGEKYYFDTVSILGKAIISSNYIAHKTGILPGSPFESKKVTKINSILNQTGFITLDTLDIEYNNSKVKLLLTLDEVRQNRFSGIVGIQTNENSKTEITGDIELQLVNTFKGGEKFYLSWKKPADESQEMNFDFQYPYLFKSPVGITGSAFFEKQDSSFSNTIITGGLNVSSYNKGDIGVLVQWKNSSTSQTGSMEYNTSDSKLYGLSYQYQTLNRFQINSNGISVHLKALAGSKKIIKTIENDYKSFFSEFQETTEWSIPASLGALFFKNQSGFLINDSLYLNNLSREGGFNSIRGFNEKSIYTKGFTYFTGAYRLIIKNNSFVEGFYDLGWFNEPVDNNYKTLLRQALGAGITLTTKAGVISVAFAVGKKENEPFAINEGKIHIGYISLF